MLILGNSIFFDSLSIAISFMVLLGGMIMTWTRLTSSISVLNTRLDQLEKTTASLEVRLQSIDKDLTQAIIQLTRIAGEANSQIVTITDYVRRLEQSTTTLLEKHQSKFDEYDKNIKEFYKQGFYNKQS